MDLEDKNYLVNYIKILLCSSLFGWLFNEKTNFT